MSIRVMVVDDSRFFRRRIVEILKADPQIEVVEAAENGAQAVEKAMQLKPDAIIMDIEMPVMDGITAVKKIMATRPTPILMFSSLTTEGARATLDALEAGAADFLPKNFEDICADREQAKQELLQRVRQIARKSRPPLRAPATSAPPVRQPAAASRPEGAAVPPALAAHWPGMPRDVKLVAIGTSTGGPVALQEVLIKLPADFPAPILLVQHMPAAFTPAFAQRLDKVCAITVKEAQDGDVLMPGTAYLAPGGRQMVLEYKADKTCIRIRDSEPGQTYKPSVDVTLGSIARAFRGRTLAIVLTGMGADGREGTRALKQKGALVWAQDEASCVVYGMPCAIVEAGLADQVMPLAEIGPVLAKRA